MPAPPIPESPSARVLLELAASSSDARVVVGGRAVLLHGGAIADVSPLAGDLAFGDFLLAAERIDQRDLDAVLECADERGIGLEQALRELDAVSEEVLYTTRRALLVDRLTRAFADEEAAGDGPPEPMPLAQLILDSSYPTLELVLDALARRAAFGQAELIGSLTSGRFVFSDGHEQVRASEWADLGDIPIAVSLATLFRRHPAAPSRIVALLRAGIGKVDVSDALTRPSGDLAEAPQPLASARPSVQPEAERARSITPEASRTSARPAHAGDLGAPLQSDENRARGVEVGAPEVPPLRTGPLGIVPVGCWLETSERTLADPLSAAEARANELDSEAREGSARARAWLELADAWLTHQHSFSEAARAAREAAAADPSSVEALACAATYTAAAGAPDIALAYSLAWADKCAPGPEQLRALQHAADCAQRAGETASALSALRRAIEAAPDDAELQEQLARALLAADNLQMAVEHARKAAELLREEAPERARALLEWVVQHAPGNLRGWTDLARVLARSARGPAAVATLAQAARMQTDVALRERLRTAAVTFAEAGSRPDLAAEVALEVLDVESIDRERLVSNLYAAGDWATLSVIACELAARTTGSERAGLLLHAAEAAIGLGARTRAAMLLCDAVVSDPDYAEALDRLAALASELGRPRTVRDALERAVRVRCPDRAAVEHLTQTQREEVAALLDRLAAFFAGPLDAPHARDVAELLYALEGRTLELEAARQHEQELALFEDEIQRWEQTLRAAPPTARSEPALELAALCRVDPTRRATAIRLYRKVLEREPEQAEALAELEALLWLEGDARGLRGFYEHACAANGDLAALVALAHLELAMGELELGLDAAFRAVSSDPRHVEALILCVRLALRLNDRERAQTVLRMLADAHPVGPARAAALMRLARLEDAYGQREAAALSARAALASDPDCADAALWLLANAQQLPAQARASALRAVRGALGDSVAVLRELARAAFASADAALQRDALQALLGLSTRDPFPARALVALHATGHDPAALCETIEALLARERFASDSLYVAQRGLLRLVELGEARRAVATVLGALPVLGERAEPLLPWAESTAAAANAPELACAALEQRVALAPAREQPERLRELAARSREASVYWAEARAYLRLLALEPDDSAALSALAAIYARTNEAGRLRNVLEVLYERAHTEEAQRERLFELALCALYFEADAERGAELVAQAVAPRREGRELYEVPVDALRRGVGLLRAASPQRAFTLLRNLAEEASAPRSRELLEEAIALAEFELTDPALALEAATQGALAHPEHEPLVEALGRLAHQLSRVDGWVDTLEAAAERTANPDRQAALLLRAAELSERELNDGPRACLLLDRAYRATPTDAIEELALEGARVLFARDLRAGKLAYDRLRDTLHVRAKFGSPVARARALITLSRLADEVYLTREDAARYAEAARASLANAEDATADERARAAEALEQRFSQMALGEPARPSSRAPSNARRSLAESDAPVFKALQGAPTLRPGGASLAPPSSLRPAIRSLLPTLEPGAPLASLAPIDIRGHGVAVTAVPQADHSEESSSVHEIDSASATDSLDAILVAVASGQTSALQSLSQRLASDQASAPAICASLLAQVRGRPVHACALRGLRLASAAASEHGLWRTASQALAFVEPQLRPPAGARRREFEGPRAEAALLAARETTQQASFELLSLLVEAAAPLFRRSLNTILRTKNAPEPLREAPYAQLLAELGQFFGVRHDAYAIANGEDRVSVVSAQPASILIGDRTTRDSASLRFRLARAFECARPEHVLLVTMTADRAEALFAALVAAFGAAAAQGQVPRDAAALAADLWRTMPSSAQRKVTRALSELEAPLSFEALRADVRLTSARVALLATRELDVALGQLGLDFDDETAAPPERSEGAFNRALAQDPLTRELIAYALSDAYLGALADPA